MFLRQESKRFQRSFVLHSPSSKQLPSAATTDSQFEPSDSNANKNQLKQPLQISNYTIWARLSELQEMLEVERLDRMREHEKMLDIMKDMQCKHSSIIYNSEIRYFKSPPKPGIFYCHNLNEDKTNSRDQTIKRVSSSVCIGTRNKQNKDTKAIRLSTQEQDKKVVLAYNPENYDKVVNEEREQHKDRIYLQQKDLNSKLQILKSELKDQIIKWQASINTQIKSTQSDSEKHHHNVTQKIDEIIKTSSTTSGQILHRIREVEEKINKIVLFTSSQAEKVLKMQRCVNEFIISFGQKLASMCQNLLRQTQDINKLENMNQLSHNIYSNKIHQIFQFLNHKFQDVRTKFDKFEAQKTRELQSERLKSQKGSEQMQNNKQDMLREIDNRIYNQESQLRDYLTKQITDRSQNIENSLITVIGRHVSTVEAYLRKNQEKQDAIMKSYLTRTQGNSLSNTRIC